MLTNLKIPLSVMCVKSEWLLYETYLRQRGQLLVERSEEPFGSNAGVDPLEPLLVRRFLVLEDVDDLKSCSKCVLFSTQNKKRASNNTKHEYMTKRQKQDETSLIRKLLCARTPTV